MQDIGREFWDKTMYRHLAPSAQERGLPQPPLQIRLGHGHGDAVELPDPHRVEMSQDLRTAIESRRSLRKYGPASLSLAELSYLLRGTQGVRRTIPGRATFRTVPSAGARHAFETVVWAHRIDGLEQGMYQYLAVEHQLMELDRSPELGDLLVSACLGQSFIADSAAVFVWIADWNRMAWRYGERGLRYLLLDAGHICQNLYLMAESIGAGVCAIGAFDDEKTNALFELDGTDRFAVYLASIGKRID